MSFTGKALARLQGNLYTVFVCSRHSDNQNNLIIEEII